MAACHVVLHLQLSADAEKREIWYTAMKHPEYGIKAFTFIQPGFIALEVAETDPAEDGSYEMFIWEKWDTKENYNAYLAKRPPTNPLIMSIKESDSKLLKLAIMDKRDDRLG